MTCPPPTSVIDEEDFASSIDFHFPQSRQIVIWVGEHVDEMNQIAVVLISLKTARIPANLVHLRVKVNLID